MRAGQLRHQGDIYSPPDPNKPDSFGDTPGAYTKAVGNVWFGLKPLSGRELFMAQQIRADVTHAVTVRGNPTITAKMELRWQDPFVNRLRVFELGPPLSDEERHWDAVFTAVERHP